MAGEMIKLTVDDIEVEVPPGSTVLRACEAVGAEIPRFCYHERLSIAGNCRMCLVEMERSPKPIASCAMPVAEGMVIRTQSERARNARKGVMEFLLINHPLDCPICDQGGECDLQDQAMAYGLDRGRYTEVKRAVGDKNLGPLIKTIMTRCIHCTRCIRFASEVAGVHVLGAEGRGEEMEITSYMEKAVASELSGNLVDVCPVGALTSKPYAFTARPWELHKTESIDVFDAVGTNTRLDSVGSQVMRALPRLHEEINEEWMADKGRYAIDGLRRQRLDQPYLRRDGVLCPTDWRTALAETTKALHGRDGTKIAAIVGDQMDLEAIFALRELMRSLGTPHLECRQDGAKIDPNQRAGYLFNTTIAGIERADACLLVATCPRLEAPLINARLRKRYLTGGFPIGLIGADQGDLTYPVQEIGPGPDAIEALQKDRHPFAATLRKASRPMLILGQAGLCRPDGAAILARIHELAASLNMIQPATDDDPGWNGYNMLHMAASRVGALELGFTPAPGGRDLDGIAEGCASGAIECVYLLGADEVDPERFKGATIIYQGHMGDNGAKGADIVLPGTAWTEKDGTYVNTEGRMQRANRAVFPCGEAREDWRIIRALSERLERTLPFDDLAGLRARMAAAAPTIAGEDGIVQAEWGAFGTNGPMDRTDFVPALVDYYMTCPVSRASETMAACRDAFSPTNRLHEPAVP